MRATLSERAESARLALAELDPGVWESRVLEESPDGRAVVEYRCEARRIIGKFRADGGGGEGMALLQQLFAQTPGVLRVPRPVAWLEPTGALLTEAAAGLPCRQLELAKSQPALVRIGRALAELHRIPMSWGEPKRLHDHSVELMRPSPEALAAATGQPGTAAGTAPGQSPGQSPGMAPGARPMMGGRPMPAGVGGPAVGATVGDGATGEWP